MRMMSENTSRKMDSLGRVSIPKSVRDRLNLKAEDILDIYLLEHEGKTFVCFCDQKQKDERYAAAAEVLEELGLAVPKELLEKI